MKKTVFIAFTTMVSLNIFCQTKTTHPTTPAPALKSLTDSFSYALGMQISTFYRQQGVKTINSAMMAKAVNDVFANKKPLLNQNDVDIIMFAKLSPDEFKQVEPNLEAGKKCMEDNKSKKGIITTPSGLQYEVITQGTGPRPTASDTVVCHYKGTLLDSTEFDNSYKRGEPATFPLNRVIRGWTEGVQLMPTGSKYRFYIPYQLGYGINGSGTIPGGALLIFEVELISIKGK